MTEGWIPAFAGMTEWGIGNDISGMRWDCRVATLLAMTEKE